MRSDSGPQHLSRALADLIALRGYARVRGNVQLQSAWADVAGPQVAGQSRATAIKRGVLQVSVAHAPLLSELVAFLKQTLLDALRTRHPHLKIKDLKFKLDSDLARDRQSAGPAVDGPDRSPGQGDR